MNKCQSSDRLSFLLITATQTFLQHDDCKKFVIERLLPQLADAGVFHDPEPQDCIEQLERWQQRVVKRISRIINGDQVVPADWVVPWLAALPLSVRERCENSIAAALGFQPIKMATIGTGLRGGKANIAELSREFADVLSASGPAMDGEYTLSDGPDALQRLQNELRDLMLKVQDEIVAIASSTGIAPAKFQEAL